MYDSISSFLASTHQFTTIALDNRGLGLSSTPTFTLSPPSHILTSSSGYTADELAADAWAVVDHVRRTSVKKYHTHVGLVGHSMGGMIVQNMLMQRPAAVR